MFLLWVKLYLIIVIDLVVNNVIWCELYNVFSKNEINGMWFIMSSGFFFWDLVI